MNYEIEMMKYANNFKKISKNKDIGLEHKKNIRGFLMGVDIIIDENVSTLDVKDVFIELQTVKEELNKQYDPITTE